MSFSDYKKPVIASICTAAILGGIAYLWNFVVFPDKNISGQWKVYAVTENTDYRPFKNGLSISIFQISQLSNNEINGNGEKIEDITANGNHTKYQTVQRDRMEFNGTIEQHKFDNATVNLPIKLFGSKYTTTALFKLIVISNDSISGTFTTTIGNGSGHVKMIRID